MNLQGFPAMTHQWQRHGPCVPNLLSCRTIRKSHDIVDYISGQLPKGDKYSRLDMFMLPGLFYGEMVISYGDHGDKSA